MYSRLPRGPKARLEEAAQRVEDGIELPSPQRCRLVQGSRLLLQQRQVVQRVVDHVAADIGAPMAGDDLGGRARSRPGRHSPSPSPSCGRASSAPSSPPAGSAPAPWTRPGPARARRPRREEAGRSRRASRSASSAAALSPSSSASRRSRQRAISRSFRTSRLGHLRDRHHELAPRRLHQGLDLPLVVALARPAEAVAEQVNATADD